ncbi:hypothetical protein E8D34_18745 [Nocardioides sp. GY 10113]|uniref:hypothetical protein n=1 Tax=Nocardioides sp. GY 10113 TaxID=2569761 RepID=UPI0010A7D774|nr:hypothetical protein [Nocardioides sp. GY 10113]TIC80688.1 hypothetical protein E8D34_18745 [Nocardioides sp. GY 10113]
MGRLGHLIAAAGPARLRVGLAAAVGVVLVGSSLAVADRAPGPRPVPEAQCGPGSRPETTGLQGRVPARDYASGRYREGYTCNTRAVGRHGSTGGFKTLRYTDARGNTCAFYDSTRLLGMDVGTNLMNGTGLGVVVLDMNRPGRPRKTDNLTSPAMLSPHESLLLNRRRGLLMAVLGTVATAPGVLDVYDVRKNCRHPRLLSSTPAGVLGHESGISPDGRTFWSAGAAGFTITAVDVSRPRRPRTLMVEGGVVAHGIRFSSDGRTMYLADMGSPSTNSVLDDPGLQIYDVSEVQDRVEDPEIRLLSETSWPGISIPQVAEPFRRRGRAYVLEVDEFTDWFGDGLTVDLSGDAPVGAARIIDVTRPRRPRMVSDLRLEVHQPRHRTAAVLGDPGNELPIGGYSAHYCSVPTRRNPQLAACSMIGSGLRIFDIRDLERPREVAYFNRPSADGANALSQPAWDRKRRSIWYTDGTSGFYAVRLTNGVGRLLRR